MTLLPAEDRDLPAALVTGGGRRLGAAMVRHLAARGRPVALHANASSTDAEALAREIRGGGGICHVVRGDLATRTGVDAIWQAARAALGPIGVLVNNASLFRNDDVFGHQDDAIDAHMAVNLKAPLRLIECMALQPDLPEGAVVVNMLDNKMFAPNPDFFTYTLSKTALHGATELCARRLGGRPRVCGIAPSITLVSGDQSMADFERTARINPLGRRVRPEDICAALDCLLGDRALNGQVMVVDGGQVLWRLPRDVAFLDGYGED